MSDERKTDLAAPREQPKSHSLGRKMTLIVCLVILLAAVGAAVFIFATEPTSEQQEPEQDEGALVEVETVERGDFQPIIDGLGAVEPARSIRLNPRVSGQIVEMSDKFVPGGLVAEGELLAQIDPADYNNVVAQRQSQLDEALANLELELGRQQVAEEEYQLLEQSLPPVNRALVLREPQLKAARAQVESARAALRQAELDLARTRIEAPFDAQVVSRNTNLGSQVAAGAPLAVLAGIDEYWVVATVPLSKVAHIELADGAGNGGSKVRLRHRAVWPAGVYREGRVQQVIGALDQQTRLARLVVTVADPLALDAARNSPRLMIDAIVQAEITGKSINDVFRINRDFMREGNTLWTINNGKLQIKEVEIAFEDTNYAYVRSGLEPGDRIVKSNLTTVTEGMPLRTRQQGRDQQQTDAGGQEGAQ